jgi:hypothetical protein
MTPGVCPDCAERARKSLKLAMLGRR